MTASGLTPAEDGPHRVWFHLGILILVSFTRTPTFLFKQAVFFSCLAYTCPDVHIYITSITPIQNWICLHVFERFFLASFFIFFPPYFTIAVDPIVVSLKLYFAVVQLVVGVGTLFMPSTAEAADWEYWAVQDSAALLSSCSGWGVMWAPPVREELVCSYWTHDSWHMQDMGGYFCGSISKVML